MSGREASVEIARIEEKLIGLIETNIGAPRRLGARLTFEMPPPPPLSAPMPMFVTQREFRMIVLHAEQLGANLVAFPTLLVHPDSLRWYMERLALYRMWEHFGMLS